MSVSSKASPAGAAPSSALTSSKSGSGFGAGAAPGFATSAGSVISYR